MIRQAEKRGVTRYQLARLAGVNQSQLSRIYKDGAIPKADTIDAIAKALGYEVRLVPVNT